MNYRQGGFLFWGAKSITVKKKINTVVQKTQVKIFVIFSRNVVTAASQLLHFGMNYSQWTFVIAFFMKKWSI